MKTSKKTGRKITISDNKLDLDALEEVSLELNDEKVDMKEMKNERDDMKN